MPIINKNPPKNFFKYSGESATANFEPIIAPINPGMIMYKHKYNSIFLFFKCVNIAIMLKGIKDIKFIL